MWSSVVVVVVAGGTPRRPTSLSVNCWVVGRSSASSMRLEGASAARIVVEFERSKMMSSSSLSSWEKRDAEKDGDAVNRVCERSR